MKVDRHDLKGTCIRLLELLAQAHASDKAAEKEKKRGSTVGCTGCLLTFAAFPVLGLMLDADGSAIPGIVLVVLGLGAAGWGWRHYSTYDAFDLDDHKLGAVRRCLELLQVDMRPEGEVTAVVDFRKADTDPFLQHKETVGSSPFGDVMAYQYRQPWLELQGRLLDGTGYSLEIVRLLKSKVKPKKKGRRKVKSLIQDRISVQLRTQSAHYPDVSPLIDSLPAQLPAQLRIRSLQAQGDRVQACFETPVATRLEYRSTSEQNVEHLGSADSLVGALVFLYRGLKQVKAGAVGQP
ncbi:MAG: hypothetical protein HY319_24320 [Armatimonadetes bacterium]|nr:hypothetical protein [Armatimonadota bacterium]